MNVSGILFVVLTALNDFITIGTYLSRIPVPIILWITHRSDCSFH